VVNERERLYFWRRTVRAEQPAACVARFSLLPCFLEGCSGPVTWSPLFAGRNGTSSCTSTWPTRALPAGTSTGMPGLCGISSSRASMSSCHSPTPRTWGCTVSRAGGAETVSSGLLQGPHCPWGLATSVSPEMPGSLPVPAAACVHPTAWVGMWEMTCWELLETLLENRAPFGLCSFRINAAPALGAQGQRLGPDCPPFRRACGCLHGDLQ